MLSFSHCHQLEKSVCFYVHFIANITPLGGFVPHYLLYISHTGRQGERQTCRQEGRLTDRQTERQAGRRKERQAGRQEGRQPDRWTDRQTVCEGGRQAG